MNEKFNVLNYEKALDILAEELDLGYPMDDKEKKKAAIYSFIDFCARQ